MILILLLACETPAELERLPVRSLVAQPCALLFDGTVQCWDSESWDLQFPYELDDVPPDLVSIQSEIPGILRGLRLDGTPELLVCQLDHCSLPDQRVAVLTDWGGLTRVGELVFNSTTWSLPDPGPYLLVDGHDPVMLSAAHVIHTRQAGSWRALPITLQGSPTHLVGDVRLDGYTACVLDDTGAVQCVGDGPQPVFPGTYVNLAGSHGAFCAQDTDDVVHCSDGSVHELGPLVRLAAARFAFVDPVSGVFVPFREAPISVCGFDDVRVRCAGPRYPSDVQADLLR